jgi:cellulose synthase/poly-beta-1,6-N-acetylglucosamine synthase-like glycosyltransferase
MSVIKDIVDFLEFLISLYTGVYLMIYFTMGILSYTAIKNYYRSKYFLQKDILIKSNHAVGVSVIAPAFNEGATVVSNVKSLLSQEYPKFEIIIVNDGSSDDTLVKLIAEFELVKVPFFYLE